MSENIGKAVPYIWFICVGVLSLLPGSYKAHLHTRGLLHTPGHIVVFAVSAFLACRSVRVIPRRGFLSLAVIGYGGVLEALQSWLWRSRFEWDDVASDACGVLLVFVFATWAEAVRKMRRPESGL